MARETLLKTVLMGVKTPEVRKRQFNTEYSRDKWGCITNGQRDGVNGKLPRGI